jgi:hypothetical protein
MKSLFSQHSDYCHGPTIDGRHSQPRRRSTNHKPRPHTITTDAIIRTITTVITTTAIIMDAGLGDTVAGITIRRSADPTVSPFTDYNLAIDPGR